MPKKKTLWYFASIIFVILLIGIAFAGETPTKESSLVPITEITASTNNIKQYDFATKTATIYDDKGITEYATIKLLTPQNNKVGIGYQKVAEFEINSKVTYADFLKEMYFYNLNNNYAIESRGFDLKQKIDYTEEINLYDNNCYQVIDKNSTKYEQCDQILKGKQPITLTRYDTITEKNFLPGTKIVSIWIETKANETIEWIPDLFGTTINEWAVWTATLDTNLTAYYDFNETSGNLIDKVSPYDNNGASTNITYSQPSILNNAYSFNNSSSKVELNNTGFPTGDITLALWFKTTNLNGNDVVYIQGAYGTTNFEFALNNNGSPGSGAVCAMNSGDGSGILSGNEYNDNNWHFAICDFNGTGLTMYVDNVLIGSQTKAGGYATTTPKIGNYSTAWYDGNITELMIWARVLTPTERTYLWNGGAGISRSTPLVVTPQTRITFNVYKTGTSTHLTGITFDSNVNALDLSGQNSPFSTIYVDQNTSADGNFTVLGYDSNYQSNLYFDSNKTMDIYLSRHVYMSHIYVYDENTTLNLTGATIDYNGTPQVLTGNVFDFNTVLFAQGTYTFTISKTGYGTRYYQAYVDGSKDFNINFMLLPTSLGIDLDYTIYNELGTATLPNTYFEMTRPDINNWIIGRRLTDASADTTIFTNVFDQNYSELIGDTNTYSMVNLSVLYPKNEQTLAQITEYFRIYVSGALSKQYTSLNATKHLYLIPNLVLPYTLKIKDMNTTYNERTYSEQFFGNPLTGTLQPYLISIGSGVSTNILTLNPSTFAAVPNINIKIYSQALGNVLVDEQVTDNSGSAIALLLSSEKYYFDVYQNGLFLKRLDITAPLSSGSTIYVYIDSGNVFSSSTSTSYLTPIFYPGNQKLNNYDTNLAQTILVNDFNSSFAITSLFIYITNTDVNGIQNYDKNIYQKTFAATGNYTNSISINATTQILDGNALSWYDTNGYLIVTMVVSTTNGTQIFSQTYKPYTGFSITQSFGFNLRPLFGCPATNNPLIPCPTLLLAALFISLVISVVMSASMGYVSINTIGFMFLLLMGIFTYISWVPYILYGIILVGTVGLMIAETGRQRL